MVVSSSLNKKERKKIIYSYKDETGRERYRKIRLEWVEEGERKKMVWFEHRNEHSHWIKGGTGENYLYKLPELVRAPKEALVFIPEGENKVDALEALGLVATCNQDGAGPGKWKKPWAKFFEGRRVVVLPDHDKVGYAHAQAIFELLEPSAAKVVELKLPGLDHKEDIIQWLEKPGNDKGKILELAEELFKAKEPPPPPALRNGDAWEGDHQAEEEPDEEWADWKPFPLDVLPPVLADYIHHASLALVCDPSYVALPVLCVAGGVLGNARWMQLKETWREPSIFWGCVVADSSTLKSPAMDIAKSPLEYIEDELVDDYQARYEIWQKQVALWEEKNGKREHSWGEEEGYSCPKEPNEGRLIITDITVEGVAKLLSQNPKGLILAMDELAGWFGSFARYKSGGSGASDLPFWLEVHRGGSRRIDRKTGDQKSIRVKRAAVSVFGTIQPKTCARVFTEEVFESGLVSRLLLVKPPKVPKVWSEAVVPHEVGEAFRQLIRRIFYLEWEACQDPKWGPTIINFSTEGKRAWVEFYNRWGGVQWESEGEQAYCLAKLEGYCARFALLLSQVEFHSGLTPYEQVNETHVKRAVQLVEWFSNEATRVYSYIKTDPLEIENDKLLATIDRHGGKMTARDLMRSNVSKFRSAEQAGKILENLVLQGVGRWETSGIGPKGGRPKKVFCLLR